MTFFLGAGDGARTRYPNLGKVALYQMSYTRIYRSCFAGTIYIIAKTYKKVNTFFEFF